MSCPQNPDYEPTIDCEVPLLPVRIKWSSEEFPLSSVAWGGGAEVVCAGCPLEARHSPGLRPPVAVGATPFSLLIHTKDRRMPAPLLLEPLRMEAAPLPEAPLSAPARAGSPSMLQPTDCFRLPADPAVLSVQLLPV